MSGDGDALVLELRPVARRVSRPTAALAAAALLVAGAWLGFTRLAELAFVGVEGARILGAVVGGALGAAIAVVLWPRLRPPARLEPLAMVGGRLRLPRSEYASGADRLDPREVLHLGVAPGRRGFVEVLTARRRYRLRLERFREPERLPELARAYHRALSRLEGGPEHLAAMEESHALGSELSRRRPVATLVLLGLLTALFAVQVGLAGINGDIFARARVALRLGANAAALTAEAPWRLLTAAFLHGSFLHLYMNGIALLALGTVLERLLGPARVLAIFLWSAAVGGVLSSAANVAGYSVGASGGIFGLLGALAALHVVGRDPIPAGFRQPLRWWIFIASINLLLPALVPVIDAWGHFGGAAAGVVLGAGFALMPGFELGGPADRAARAAAGVALAAYLVAIGFAWTHALRPREHHERVLERVLLSKSAGDSLAAASNAVAVLTSETAPEHLKRAADRYLGSAALGPSADPEVRLAGSELLEARGALEAAAHLRWEALQDDGPGAFPALVDALSRLESPPLVIAPAEASGVEASRLSGDDRMELALDPPVDEAAAVYLLHRGPTGAVRDLLEVPVGGGPEPQAEASLRIPEALLESLEAGGRLDVVLWAPALSSQATLHPLSPAALESWRLLPLRP